MANYRPYYWLKFPSFDSMIDVIIKWNNLPLFQTYHNIMQKYFPWLLCQTWPAHTQWNNTEGNQLIWAAVENTHHDN